MFLESSERKKRSLRSELALVISKVNIEGVIIE